jgi:hypothetical protein
MLATTVGRRPIRSPRRPPRAEPMIIPTSEAAIAGPRDCLLMPHSATMLGEAKATTLRPHG